MFDPGETAVDAEPEPQILHRLLATTNKGEHLCARQFQSHRAAGFPGSQHRPEHPRPPKLPLAAEAAAQKTRDDADVRCLHLHGVRLHVMMVVDGRLVSMSDDEIGLSQRPRCVTTTRLGRKASYHGRCK